MANIKSQIKRIRTNNKAQARNKGERSAIKTAIRHFREAVATGDKSDIDKAVKAAQLAYTKLWSKLSGAERGKYLYRIARILQERAREFAVLETLDNGKPIRETRDIDIPLVAAHFFYHAGWADKLEYAGLGQSPKPYGVVGQIIPWNFPLLMLSWKVAPALATGNTIVLKPAETTPLTALLFAQVCEQAGLPAGVVNIVTGDGKTGAALVNHRDIDKVAFTGSTEVGKIIARSVANTNKKLTLDHVFPRHLGGKHEWENLVTSCSDCNQKKAGKTLENSSMTLLSTAGTSMGSRLIWMVSGSALRRRITLRLTGFPAGLASRELTCTMFISRPL